MILNDRGVVTDSELAGFDIFDLNTNIEYYNETISTMLIKLEGRSSFIEEPCHESKAIEKRKSSRESGLEMETNLIGGRSARRTSLSKGVERSENEELFLNENDQNYPRVKSEYESKPFSTDIVDKSGSIRSIEISIGKFTSTVDGSFVYILSMKDLSGKTEASFNNQLNSPRSFMKREGKHLSHNNLKPHWSKNQFSNRSNINLTINCQSAPQYTDQLRVDNIESRMDEKEESRVCSCQKTQSRIEKKRQEKTFLAHQ